LYNTVIQQLKQQKHELNVQTKAEQARTKTIETLSHAVLSNLPCGVLVFGTNGLIKTANPAAKQILGFASASGMSANDIFRGAVVTPARFLSSRDGAAQRTPAEPVRLADEVSSVLREGSNKRELEAEYKTPAGTKRFLAVTISKICADDGPLGVACLIDDLSELEQIRQQQELHGEISAEMALQLRTSLATISGYAQQLSATRDPESAKQIASDIALEAAQLERSIGGFLRKKETGTAANA
jgi:nitrogen fixation/metabolism regulation signal transduction histidine kinase